MRFSVIICTRNRAASLRETLEAVFDQVPNQEISFEVIVVDNGSTDATKPLVAEFLATLPDRHYSNLKYCYESQPGLSYARNRGLEEAPEKSLSSPMTTSCRSQSGWNKFAENSSTILNYIYLADGYYSPRQSCNPSPSSHQKSRKHTSRLTPAPLSLARISLFVGKFLMK